MTATKTQLDKAQIIVNFMGQSQQAAIRSGLRGEERDFFKAKVAEYAERIAEMPVTYGQDGLGDQAIAYLHYFTGAWDWWITEKDVDSDGEGHIQAFGLVRGHEVELGYINIPELLKNGAELDLYFTPKTLAEVKAQA